MKKPNIICLLLVCTVLCFTACSKKKKASCSDGLKNQDEVFTDCGGVCSPCETCSDGILNQNETSTDCGGVCSKCGTCNDGIQNQGESGIDCGGPCGICGITYSEFGAFGYNILHDDTVTHFLTSQSGANYFYNYYSLRCKVEEGVRVKVVFTKLSGSGMWLAPQSPAHWEATNLVPNTSQEFTTIGEVTAETRFYFSGSGTARMQIFERGASTPTREKIISWN